MTSIGPSSLAYSFGKSREKLVLFVTIWAFQHSSRKTKHLCALMEPKQGFECGSWAKQEIRDEAISQSADQRRQMRVGCGPTEAGCPRVARENRPLRQHL